MQENSTGPATSFEMSCTDYACLKKGPCPELTKLGKSFMGPFHRIQSTGEAVYAIFKQWQYGIRYKGCRRRDCSVFCRMQRRKLILPVASWGFPGTCYRIKRSQTWRTFTFDHSKGLSCVGAHLASHVSWVSTLRLWYQMWKIGSRVICFILYVEQCTLSQWNQLLSTKKLFALQLARLMKTRLSSSAYKWISSGERNLKLILYGYRIVLKTVLETFSHVWIGLGPSKRFCHIVDSTYLQNIKTRWMLWAQARGTRIMKEGQTVALKTVWSLDLNWVPCMLDWKILKGKSALSPLSLTVSLCTDISALASVLDSIDENELGCFIYGRVTFCMVVPIEVIQPVMIYISSKCR